MPRSICCEVREGSDDWLFVTVEDVIERRNRGDIKFDKRCVECHGRVRAHKAGVWGAAHFEHMQRHSGCSLGDNYDGKGKRIHPDAI